MRLSLRKMIASNYLALILVMVAMGWDLIQTQQEIKVYDKAFEGVSYSSKAHLAFQRFMLTHQGANASFADAGSSDDIPAVKTSLDLANELTFSRKESALIQEIEEKLAALPKSANPAEVAADIDKQLSRLNGKYAADRVASVDSAMDDLEQSKHSTTFILLCVAALGAFLATVLMMAILPQIRYSAEVAEKIAGGKLDNEITVRGTTEIAQLLDALSRMQKAISQNMAKIVESSRMQKIAEDGRRTLLLSLSEGFEKNVLKSVDAVAVAADNMTYSAGSLSSTAEETASKVTTVSAGAVEASANVQTVTVAAGQLALSISQISKNVQEATAIFNQVSREASQTNDRMKALSATAQKIGDVVNLITDIAGQTNLLALNATIEAAKAGEAGKGFAVIASEVKTLANQTAKATGDISRQISEMQQSTQNAVVAIASITAIIARCDEIQTNIGAAVEEQDAATNEIMRNVTEASHGTAEVSRNISEVTKAAESTGESAALMLDESKKLVKLSEEMRAEVRQFLSSIRTS